MATVSEGTRLSVGGMSARARRTNDEASPQTTVVTAAGHARLEELYSIGQTRMEPPKAAIQSSGRAPALGENEDVGAFDWARREYQRTVEGSNFKFESTLSGLEAVHFGTKRVVCKNYVEYKHSFPPFMVKVKGLERNISDAKYVAVHPLSIKVFDALTTTPSFMITESENSLLTCVNETIKDACFEIADIDPHFSDVVKNMNLAYTYYQKEERAWKRKNAPGRHDSAHPENTTPSFDPPAPPRSDSPSDGMEKTSPTTRSRRSW